MTTREMATVKLRVKNAMESYLYSPFEDYYRRELEAIIEQNDIKLYGSVRSWIFTYKAVRYFQVRFKKPPQKVERLCPELHARMDALLNEKAAIERDEKPLVMGYVMRVLNSSADLSTVLKAFPTTLRPPIESALLASGIDTPALGTSEAGEAVHASESCVAAVKTRLMTNLLLGSR